jgi:Arc/MetJ family transcription regulator
VPPRQVRLDELVTTKRTLDLAQLLADDSTFYGDLFAHVVQWQDTMYLEDGLHRAVRAALGQRTFLHARVLVLDA